MCTMQKNSNILERIAATIITWIALWGACFFTLIIIFCVLFDMHPRDSEYLTHYVFLNRILYALVPITGVIAYIIQRDKE